MRQHRVGNFPSGAALRSYPEVRLKIIFSFAAGLFTKETLD
jgi:hypothetical protein